MDTIETSDTHAMRAFRIVAVALAILLLGVGCATREDVQYLDQRLSGLELKQKAKEVDLGKKMSAISAKGQDTEDQIRRQIASLRVDLDALSQQVALLNGKIEENAYGVKKRVQALEDAEKARQTATAQQASTIEAMQAKLMQIEDYLDMEPNAGAPAGPDALKPDAEGKASLTAADIYRLAKHAYDNNSFDVARHGFLTLLKKFPKSDQADNAQFWIGETYYREKDFKRAILEYQKVIENYPKGNKVPAALLKQGFAFYRINDNASAVQIFKELIRRYPKSNEARLAHDRLRHMK